MSNQIFRIILVASSILVLALFFMYRSYGWPFGRESLEACIAFGVCMLTTFFYNFYLHKQTKKDLLQERAVKIGLLTGLLWTIEISMNNILRPGLPKRDIYDDVFWAAIALIIVFTAIYYGFVTKKIMKGIQAGFWSGFSSGAVAGLTALIFIIFGMSQILLDPLNITEWSARGASSNTPSIAVYFAYQTLAGAVLHLVVLGIIMGLLLGTIGGVIGKTATLVRKRK